MNLFFPFRLSRLHATLCVGIGVLACMLASTLSAQVAVPPASTVITLEPKPLLELKKANVELRIQLKNLEATVAERDARIVLLNDSLSKLLQTLINSRFGEDSQALAEELRQINAEISDPLIPAAAAAGPR